MRNTRPYIGRLRIRWSKSRSGNRPAPAERDCCNRVFHKSLAHLYWGLDWGCGHYLMWVWSEESDLCLNWWGCGLLVSPRERPEVDACGAFAAAVAAVPFHFAFDPKNEKKIEIQLRALSDCCFSKNRIIFFRKTLPLK